MLKKNEEDSNDMVFDWIYVLITVPVQSVYWNNLIGCCI